MSRGSPRTRRRPAHAARRGIALAVLALALALAGACKDRKTPEKATPPSATTGKALPTLLASAQYKALAKLAGRMRLSMRAGRCAEAVARAPKLAALIAKTVGPSLLTLKLKEIGKQIQADPRYRDPAFMRFKAKLQGMEVGLRMAPVAYQMAKSRPDQQKRICKQLGEWVTEVPEP